MDSLAGLAADVLVVVHLGFVAFVAVGGLLVVRWPRVAAVHVPAVAWGAWVELSGSICPLTPLENTLRAVAGRGEYAGDFVSRYLVPVLYPAGFTRDVQVSLGLFAIGVNVAIYGVLGFRAWRWRRDG